MHIAYVQSVIVIAAKRNISLRSDRAANPTSALDCSAKLLAKPSQRASIILYRKETCSESGEYKGNEKEEMARRFYNQRERILAVVLFTLVVIQRIDGYPSKRPRVVRQSKFPRSVVNTIHDGPVPACHNTTFCVDTPYYPSDYVNNMLNMNEKFKYLATVDVPSKLATRDLEDEEALCTSTEEVVRPKSALSIDDAWRYIVNNDKLTQAVRVEICKSRNSGCKIIDGFAEGYTTTCKQMYIYRQLVAVVTGGMIGTELFKVPASCKCYIKFTGDPLLRIGVRRNEKNKQTPVPKRLRH